MEILDVNTALARPGKARIERIPRGLAVCGVVGLLTTEVVVLTLRFDSQALVDAGLPLVGYARYLPRGLMAAGAAAATLALGGPRLWAGWTASATNGQDAGIGDGGRGVRPLVFLGAHLAAFVALAILTGAVWEGSLGRSAHASAWLAAWFAAGLATLALGLAAVVPAGAWPRLARRSSGAILAALAFGVAACGAGRFTVDLPASFHAATLRCVHAALALAFHDVVSRPGQDVVGVGTFRVEVAAACSGYEGIGLIWAFLTAYLWVFRRTLRFPQALWLLPIGTMVIWLANVARIVALVAIGARVSPAVALGGFHSQAGWLAFNVVALGLVAVSRRARVFAVEADAERPAPRPGPIAAAGVNPTAAYLVPMLALVAAVMTTTALSRGDGGFDAYYPARIAAVAGALWIYRRGYVGARWSWSWPAVAIGVAAFAVWMALEPARGADPAGTAGVGATLARLPTGLAALWIAARVIGSVVTVPIAEELAFRGYLARRLIAADFTSVAPGRLTWLAFVVSSSLFGVLHGRWLAGTLAGALYALAVHRKGRLSDAVLAHATTNALIAAHVLATGSWSLWA